MKKILLTTLLSIVGCICLHSQTKAISSPAIVGSDYVCAQGTESYIISNLSGLIKTITWTNNGRAFSGAPNPIVTVSGHACSIENRYSYPVDIVLLADITLTDGSKLLLSKTVKSLTANVKRPKGMYRSNPGNGNFFSGNLDTDPLYIPTGTIKAEIDFVFDNDGYIQNYDIWPDPSSTQPLSWSYDKSGRHLFVKLDPYSYGPYRFIIGKKDNPKDAPCGNYVFTFYLNRTKALIQSIDSKPASVNIYNINTGFKVYGEKNPTDFNIESTNLDKGIYIIETTDETGKIKREKVMKTK